jgi:FkbM family methyltransferase
MKDILKKIYKWLPFKKQLFMLLSWLPIPETVFKHLYFNGLFSVKIADKRFKLFHYGYQLENEIFWKGLEGGWEKTSIRIWQELSNKSECIFDIGANTGIFSLVSKAINPKAKVYAFEPVDRVFNKLSKNITLNEFDITAVCKALSNFEGKAVIYDLPTEHVYSVTVNENTNPPDRHVIPTEIAVTSLDAYCKQINLQQIDLLKIDVETHEPAVLEGGIEMIRRCLPAMIIEILNVEVAAKVNSILKEFDYLYFALNENDGPVQQKEISPHQFNNYLICQLKDARSLNLIA